jgi:hypothetical protein
VDLDDVMEGPEEDTCPLGKKYLITRLAPFPFGGDWITRSLPPMSDLITEQQSGILWLQPG